MAYKEPKFDKNGIRALSRALDVQFKDTKKSATKKSGTSKKKK